MPSGKRLPGTPRASAWSSPAHAKSATQSDGARSRTASRPARLESRSGARASTPATAGRSANHAGPVQFSLGTCDSEKAANTTTGANAASAAKRKPRALSVLASPRPSSPRSGRLASAARPAIASGVSSSATPPASRCSANSGGSSSRRELWNRKDAQWFSAFHTTTGENSTSVSAAPAHGSGRASCARARRSSSANASAPSPSSAIVYFASSPSPRQAPAPHHARGRSSTSAHQRNSSAPVQAAASGASGVITTPLVNENGSAATSARHTAAAVFPSQR